MKITTDVNTNIETISGSNTEHKGSSILDTLFSIDINNGKVLLKKPVDAGPLMFLHLMKDD